MKTKKTLSLILALGLTLGLATGCGSSNSSDKTATDDAADAGKKTQFVVATWGGASEKGLREIVKPFEAENNVEVVFDIGNNSDRINKVRAQKNNPAIDVVLLSENFAAMGNEEGLFEKIDDEIVTNTENLYDFAKNKDGFGPVYSATRYGLVYNTEKITEAPTSWADMWKSEYENKIAIPDITSTAGPMILVTAANLNGGDTYNIDPGFTKMQELKANIFNFYLSPTDVITMFERGEIVMAPFLDIFVKQMQDSGLPIAMADTKEGTFATLNTVNVVKGSKNTELAQKFVDFILSKESQEQMGNILFEGPTNKMAELDETVTANMAYGEKKISELITFDWNHINSVKDEWVERWNKEIAK